MKRYLLTTSIIIFLIPIIIFIFINININTNIKTNKKILDIINNIFSKQTIEITNNTEMNLPKLEIDNKDYIGVINILEGNIQIPIKSNCNSSYISIDSACDYSTEHLIILGTNLKDSFKAYKQYDIDDNITFTNMLGQIFEYKINKIKRTNNLNNLSQYKEDLIIVVKNYYAMEYILFICN